MNVPYKKLCSLVRWCLIISYSLLMLPVNSAAEKNILVHFSFDDCDPFEARALIVEIHAKKTQFVAAEETIYVVNLSLGDQRVTTELADVDGNRMDFESFRQGEWIYIKGFKHIDGGVVASLVQKIDPPERNEPVLRKIPKKSRRDKINRRASASPRE